MTSQIVMPRGWHFVADNWKLGYRDGRVVRPGEIYTIPDLTRKIALCAYGMHSSRRLIDALYYARGNILCRVEDVPGHMVIEGNNKVVSTARKVIACAEASELLFELARIFAAGVFWKHFKRKDYPEVATWLDASDISARSAARSAALSAARSAAGSAAGSAAWSAAGSAAESTAWSAAWSAAESAAESAAWSAAGSAAWSAAGSAAESAAWRAAWRAARSTAWNEMNLIAEAKAKEFLNVD